MSRELFSEEFISTGIIPLDLILGGGVCRGDVVEFASLTGLGKTIITVQAAAYWVLASGLRVLYLDVEKGLKSVLLKRHGLLEHWSEKIGDPFCVKQISTYGESDDILKKVFFRDDPLYDIVITDSLAEMNPKIDKDEDVAKIDVGLTARQQGKWITKYRTQARQSGSVLWVLNQMRTHLDFNSVNSGGLRPSGGNKWGHSCDVRIMMTGKEQIIEERLTAVGPKKVKVGSFVNLFTTKNRNVSPFVKIPVPVYYPQGVSNALFLWDLAVREGLLTQGGSYYTFNHVEPVEKMQGKKKALAWLRQSENYQLLKSVLAERGALELVRLEEV